MQINCASTNFVVATSRTEGIPEHAIEIQGPLVELGKLNLAKWGVKSVEHNVGIPIRICNSSDPHECDLSHDRFSQIGYVTEFIEKDGWTNAKAAVTDKIAAQKIEDGTWTPFGKGSWSVSGYPLGDELEEGLTDGLSPISIALIIPPAEPAYQGSGYEVVAAAIEKHAAVWSTAYINSLPNSSFAYVESCYGETTDNKNARHLPYKDSKGVVDLPHLRNALARVNQIKPICPEDKANKSSIIDRTRKKLENVLKAQKGAAMTELEDTPDKGAEPASEGGVAEETVSFTQEQLDQEIAKALEAQKATFDEQLTQMTPTSDLEKMIAAAKTEAVETTLDKINREKLANEYIEMVRASKVLSAPFMEDGKLDSDKLASKKSDVSQLAAASIESLISDTKMMVAALPGETAFNAADVPDRTPDKFDYAAVDAEFNRRLGVR